jgi:hypothetical protein
LPEGESLTLSRRSASEVGEIGRRNLLRPGCIEGSEIAL